MHTNRTLTTVLIAGVVASTFALGCGNREGPAPRSGSAADDGAPEKGEVLSFRVDGMRRINGAL